MLFRVRRRRWLWWHMRHPRRRLIPPTWTCSCGSRFANEGKL